MVKEDYLNVNVAQVKYVYHENSQYRANMDLALTVLSAHQFPLLDFLAFKEGLVTSWELLGCMVYEDEDYKRLGIEKWLELTVDPRCLGLINELVIDPNVASSSLGPTNRALI